MLVYIRIFLYPYSMELEFLGTGTSHGVPVIGCNCKVCKSSDPKNNRMRCSAYLTDRYNTRILIDCGPEFRIQALRSNIQKIDAVLMTHSHADHLFGIDDLRIFSCVLSHKPDNPNAKNCYAPPIPLYSNKKTLEDIQCRFNYIFEPAKLGGGHANIHLEEAKAPFTIGETVVTPIPMMHGKLPVTGWLISEENPEKPGSIADRHSIAYLTDLNFLSEKSIELIKQFCGSLDHVIVDGLREKEHETHFSYLQALELLAKLPGKHGWLTHFTHNKSHIGITEYLEEHKNDYEGLKNYESILPAWDTLKIQTE